jgi:hypothetical protein
VEEIVVVVMLLKATALKNKQCMLIFDSCGGGDGIGKENHLRKQAIYARFQGWRWCDMTWQPDLGFSKFYSHMESHVIAEHQYSTPNHSPTSIYPPPHLPHHHQPSYHIACGMTGPRKCTRRVRAVGE